MLRKTMKKKNPGKNGLITLLENVIHISRINFEEEVLKIRKKKETKF